MATQKISDDSFETDVLKAQGPVLVDFWAEWCRPCKPIGEALEEISEEMLGEVSIVKLTIDDNPLVASRLNVRVIPTLMLFKDGKLQDSRSGGMPKSKIVEWLRDNI